MTFENRQKNHKFRIYFFIILIQSIASSLWLLLMPKEAAHAVFLGYSIRRLVLLVPILLPAVFIVFINYKLKRSKDWRKWLDEEGKKARLSIGLIICGFIAVLAAWSYIFLYYFLNFLKDAGFYARLMPLLISYLLLGLEMIAFVITFMYRIPERNKKARGFPWKPFLAVLVIIVIFFLLVEIVGWGNGFTRIVIVSLGVPLLEGQIWYICGIVLLIVFSALAWEIIPNARKPRLEKYRDILVFLILWVVAVALWSTLPLPEHNYFAPSVRAPNFEKYPFSDAEQYDYNSLYILYGTADNFVISKPFYVSFLSLLHLIVGLDYVRVVFLQTLVIALFPGMLYLIGKELHSRLSGVAISLLAIFREINSIQASTMANVSNSKLLLSGMIAALLASFIVYVIVRWFKSPGQKVSGHAFLIGGIIGVFILTRLQAMALVPFGILLIVVRYYKNFKLILYSLFFFVVALGLVLVPVLMRNHMITGVYWVDNPASTGGLYRYFILDDDYEIEVPEAETLGDQLTRNISVISMAFTRGLGDILQFLMDHFIRNEVSSFLIMPVRLGNQIEFIDFLKINRPFWAELYTERNLINLIVLTFNAIMIALGFSYAYKHNSRGVLGVIGFHLVYSLSSAIVRLAGWRFILPADWIIVVFYTIGLVELIFAFTRVVFKQDLEQLAINWAAYSTDTVPQPYLWSHYLGFGLIFLLIGSFIPLRDGFSPSSVPEHNREKICSAFISAAESNPTNDSEDVGLFCESEQTTVMIGYGVYPRFFDENEGYYDRPGDLRFGIHDYSRLTFRLIGNPNASVFIKTDRKEIDFPNGALVYALSDDLSNGEADYLLIVGGKAGFVVSNEILSKSDA